MSGGAGAPSVGMRPGKDAGRRRGNLGIAVATVEAAA